MSCCAFFHLLAHCKWDFAVNPFPEFPAICCPMDNWLNLTSSISPLTSPSTTTSKNLQRVSILKQNRTSVSNTFCIHGEQTKLCMYDTPHEPVNISDSSGLFSRGWKVEKSWPISTLDWNSEMLHRILVPMLKWLKRLHFLWPGTLDIVDLGNWNSAVQQFCSGQLVDTQRVFCWILARARLLSVGLCVCYTWSAKLGWLLTKLSQPCMCLAEPKFERIHPRNASNHNYTTSSHRSL